MLFSTFESIGFTRIGKLKISEVLSKYSKAEIVEASGITPGSMLNRIWK